MTRYSVGAGVLALLLPIASPIAAQEECTCVRGEGPVIAFGGPQDFSFMTLGQARIGIGLASGEQDGFLDVGAVITEVVEDGPAEEAGLEVGDVVTSIDGHDLMEPLSSGRERFIDEDGSVPVQRLMALARDWEADEPVELTVLRDGEERSFTVVPEERDFDFGPMRMQMRELGESMGQLAPHVEWYRDRARDDARDGVLGLRSRSNDGGRFAFEFGPLQGLELTELNPRLGSYFGVESGVLVTDVDADSTLGLEPGDVILGIGDRDVNSPRDVRRILGSYDSDEEVHLEVRRDGSTQTITGTMN